MAERTRLSSREREQCRKTFIKLVGKKTGATFKVLVETAEVSEGQGRGVLKELMDEKQVERRGTKRVSTYHTAPKGDAPPAA